MAYYFQATKAPLAVATPVTSDYVFYKVSFDMIKLASMESMSIFDDISGVQGSPACVGRAHSCAPLQIKFARPLCGHLMLTLLLECETVIFFWLVQQSFDRKM